MPEASNAGPGPTSSMCHSPALPTAMGSTRLKTSLVEITRFQSWSSATAPFHGRMEPLMRTGRMPSHVVTPAAVPSATPLTYSVIVLAAES